MLSFAAASLAQDKTATTTPADAARVFVTDSESWSVSGQAGGGGGAVQLVVWRRPERKRRDHQDFWGALPASEGK